MNEAVLSCPFCAQAPTIDFWRGEHQVICRNSACLVKPSTCLFSTEQEAIASWNDRAPKEYGDIE